MFETFYESVKSSINSPFNCLTATIHYVLVKKGFRCVGMNEELFTVNTIPSTIKSSELMPKNWNKNAKQLSLIYHDNISKSNFLLKVVNAKDLALVHLMRNTNENLTKLSIEYKTYLSTSYTQFETAYTKLDDLLVLIDAQLVEPLFKEDREREKKQKEDRSFQPPPPSYNPSQPPTCSSPYHIHPPFQPPNHPLVPPILPCGRNDLDPFGQCGANNGGMIFDPLRVYRPPHRPPSNISPSHIPRGSVPPGARFDPMDPFSGPSGIFGPDPDEMHRPNFDDQFNQ